MPNRIIREGLIDSDRIAKLSAEAEVFYLHLLLKADDFGHYDGRVTVLCRTLFPAKSDVKESDVSKCLAECMKEELVELHQTEKGPVLRINEFRQKIRTAKSRWPIPDDSVPVTTTKPEKASAPSTMSLPLEDEPAVPAKTKRMEKARPLLFYLNEKASRNFRETEMNLLLIAGRLEEVGGDVEGVKRMIDRQCARWKTDPKMGEFLRPETLFGKEKFGGYYDNRDMPVASGDQRGTSRPNTTRRLSSERDEFLGDAGQNSPQGAGDDAGKPSQPGQQPEF